MSNRTGSGNAYWLKPKGQHVLELLVSEARKNCTSIPKLSYNKPNEMSLDKYTTFKQIINQIYQINYSTGVSLNKWGTFFGYYYNNLSPAQRALFDRDYPSTGIVSAGLMAKEYLVDHNPFPQIIDFSKRISEHQQFAELMWNLDYQELGQEKKFRSVIMSNNSLGVAFLLSARNQNLQEWLVCRLMRWVKYGVWNEIEVQYSKYEKPWSLLHFWEQISRNSNDNYLSEIINNILEHQGDILIDAVNNKLVAILAKYAEKRYTLIKVRNIEKSHAKILVEKFWEPLLLQLNQESLQNNLEARLFMFVVNEDSLSLNCGCQVHCLEPPLNIGYEDIVRWVDSPNVKEHLLKDRTERVIHNWLIKDVSSWTYKLPDLFDNLIPYVSYKSTLDKVAQYWKIGA